MALVALPSSDASSNDFSCSSAALDSICRHAASKHSRYQSRSQRARCCDSTTTATASPQSRTQSCWVAGQFARSLAAGPSQSDTTRSSSRASHGRYTAAIGAGKCSATSAFAPRACKFGVAPDESLPRGALCSSTARPRLLHKHNTTVQAMRLLWQTPKSHAFELSCSRSTSWRTNLTKLEGYVRLCEAFALGWKCLRGGSCDTRQRVSNVKDYSLGERVWCYRRQGKKRIASRQTDTPCMLIWPAVLLGRDNLIYAMRNSLHLHGYCLPHTSFSLRTCAPSIFMDDHVEHSSSVCRLCPRCNL
jgi:hypothetical protein